MANAIQNRSSGMLVASNQFIEKIRKHAEMTHLEFTDYQKTCVMNAIMTIDPLIKSSGYSWNDFDIDNTMIELKKVAFLKLNPTATPRECYFIVRKNKDKHTGQIIPTIEFGIEGAGNDVILRKFGQDVDKVKSYIIYEGDEYDLGEMNGWEYVLPKHKRTFKTNKPLYAVYLIKKTDGEIEVAISSREDVKISLLAHARSNGADEKLLREMNKKTLDELLSDPKYIDMKIKKSYGKNNYESPLLSPAWSSVVSQESMVMRKIRNHAVRRYPKNFDPEVQGLYEDTFGDEKHTRNIIDADEQIAIEDGKFASESNSKPVKHSNEDITFVDDEQDEIETVEYETSEDDVTVNVNVDENEAVEAEVEVETETEVEEEETTAVDEAGLPDWMK